LRVKAEMLQPRIETVQRQQFTVGTDPLELTLNERALKELRIEVHLLRGVTTLPALLPLAGIHPLGVEKHSGLVMAMACRFRRPPTKCGRVDRGAQRTDIL